MNELVAGIDLCDEYTQVNCKDEEKTWTFPTVLCRHKVSGTWSVGEDAYAQTLRGEGSLTDKLVKLVLKEGTATLEGIRYTAVELLERFLEQADRLGKHTFIRDMKANADGYDLLYRMTQAGV